MSFDLLSYILGMKRGGGGGGGGDTNWLKLEVYVADYLTDPPTIIVGAIDNLHRWLIPV